MTIQWKDRLDDRTKQLLLYAGAATAGVLMAVVILCNLLLIISNIREPEQMPSVFGIRPAIVLSGSMSPTFEPGDVILLKKTKVPEKLDVGDVACYLYSGKATTHRVIEQFEADGKPRYIMKGDYNNVEDRLAVDPDQIQGVWTGGRIRGLGRFLMFIQSTMGMFLLLICPLAGILSWDIYKRRREDRLRQEAWESENVEALELRRPEARRHSELGAERQEPPHAGADSQGPPYAEEEPPYTSSASMRRPSMDQQEDRNLRRPDRKREHERRGASRRALEWEDDFSYYSMMDEELDYYQELEEAAEHYRRMKEALARYHRMEAVMKRCRRLEEELARYEALADRLETYERMRDGVSNQRTGTEPSVDHIDRQTRPERAE